MEREIITCSLIKKNRQRIKYTYEQNGPEKMLFCDERYSDRLNKPQERIKKLPYTHNIKGDSMKLFFHTAFQTLNIQFNESRNSQCTGYKPYTIGKFAKEKFMLLIT